MYYKRVPMSLREAVLTESIKGFDTRDEFNEVMLEISEVYDVTLSKVLMTFYNLEKGEVVA